MKEYLESKYNICDEKISILDSSEFLCRELYRLNLSSDEVILSYNHIKSLGSSTKIKNYINKVLDDVNVLVFQNVLCELDYKDKIEILNNIKNKNITFINITNDIEETLYFDRIIIIYNNKVICDGKKISVLNEEKLLKRLGYSLPFIIDLNRYMMDYNITNKYYLSNEELIDELWK